MEKSLYFEYVRKYFPKLILSIVEKLNDANQTQLSYMFKQLLSTEYSVDGRWESLVGQYTRVAADVVAMDSPLPLKKRDSMSRKSGELPKMGMELFLNEKQMTDIDTMLALGTDVDTIVQKIFADTPRVIVGIYERVESMFLEGFSTGVALADEDNVGTGVRIDYGYLTENKFGVAQIWNGNPTTAKAIDDISKVVRKATDDGNRIIRAYADKYWFDEISKNQQAREEFAFLQGFVGDKAPNLLNDQVSAVMERKFGFPVQLIDRAVRTEKNGVQTTSRPWKEGTIVFICDTQVGSLVWARLAEMNHPVAGVSYETADNYILVSKYRENRPSLREYTTSQARVVPVISNPDRIYTQDIKTVQA